MSYRLQLEKNFTKHYAKLTAKERGMVDNKLRILAQDPWHPSLRTKRIQGTVAFEGDRIIMLDVDHHDKLLKWRSSR